MAFDKKLPLSLTNHIKCLWHHNNRIVLLIANGIILCTSNLSNQMIWNAQLYGCRDFHIHVPVSFFGGNEPMFDEQK